MGSSSSSSSISNAELDLQRESNKLQKQNTLIQGQSDLMNVRSTILGMEESLAQYSIDLLDYQTQISSYDQWLGNYQNLYDMQTKAKDAEIAQFEQSGLESFNSFMNALGGADAAAGMTGRVGAKTSMAAAAGQIDQALAAYAGEDRSLAGSDGTYGMQATVLDLQKKDLITDLGNQKASMEGQKSVAKQAAAMTQSSIERTAAAKTTALEEQAKLEAFVNQLTEEGESERAAELKKAADDAYAKGKADAEAKYKAEEKKNTNTRSGGQQDNSKRND